MTFEELIKKISSGELEGILQLEYDSYSNAQLEQILKIIHLSPKITAVSLNEFVAPPGVVYRSIPRHFSGSETEAYANALKNNQTLTSIQFMNGKYFEVQELEYFLKVLPSTRITAVHFHNTHIGPNGLKLLAEYVASHPLTSLEITGDQIGGELAYETRKHVSYHSNPLRMFHSAEERQFSFEARKGALINPGILDLARIIACPTLTNLNISNNGLTYEQLMTIINALPAAKALTKFTVGRQSYPCGHSLDTPQKRRAICTALASSLIKCATLESLNLESLHLGDVGIQALAQEIFQFGKPLQLKELNLSDNELTITCTSDLLTILTHCPNLSVLEFSENPKLGNEIIQILNKLTISSKDSALNRLLLVNTGLTTDIETDLVNLLWAHPNITELHLNDNLLESATITLLKTVFTSRTALKSLNLTSTMSNKREIDLKKKTETEDTGGLDPSVGFSQFTGIDGFLGLDEGIFSGYGGLSDILGQSSGNESDIATESGKTIAKIVGKPNPYLNLNRLSMENNGFTLSDIGLIVNDLKFNLSLTSMPINSESHPKDRSQSTAALLWSSSFEDDGFPSYVPKDLPTDLKTQRDNLFRRNKDLSFVSCRDICFTLKEALSFFPRALYGIIFSYLEKAPATIPNFGTVVLDFIYDSNAIGPIEGVTTREETFIEQLLKIHSDFLACRSRKDSNEPSHNPALTKAVPLITASAVATNLAVPAIDISDLDATDEVRPSLIISSIGKG